MLSTITKLKIARVLNWPIVNWRMLTGQEPITTVRRNGVWWELDLNEGIDLALFLGVYQKTPQRVTNQWIRPGSFIVDIGANIGAFALTLANKVNPSGRVVAIEPTDYAFSKLQKNISLNPQLARCLVPVHAALNEGRANGVRSNSFYSSWPLAAKSSEKHQTHQGRSEAATNTQHLSLDELLEDLRQRDKTLGTISFVKLDVDGYELSVLRGASRTLKEDRPVILIEIAPSVQDEVKGRFEALLGLLSICGYHLQIAHSGKALPNSVGELRKLIAAGSSIDALAVPAD